jgi:hypothetical protein
MTKPVFKKVSDRHLEGITSYDVYVGDTLLGVVQDRQGGWWRGFGEGEFGSVTSSSFCLTRREAVAPLLKAYARTREAML